MPGDARLRDYVLTEQTIEKTAMQKIHIGNLAAVSTEAGVRELFAPHGEVNSYERPLDSETKKASGFAFVEMSQPDAAKAIVALNGKQLDGQALRVSEAKPPRS